MEETSARDTEEGSPLPGRTDMQIQSNKITEYTNFNSRLYEIYVKNVDPVGQQSSPKLRHTTSTPPWWPWRGHAALDDSKKNKTFKKHTCQKVLKQKWAMMCGGPKGMTIQIWLICEVLYLWLVPTYRYMDLSNKVYCDIIWIQTFLHFPSESQIKLYIYCLTTCSKHWQWKSVFWEGTLKLFMILLNHAFVISNKIDGATTFLSFLPVKQPEFLFLLPPILIVAHTDRSVL